MVANTQQLLAEADQLLQSVGSEEPSPSSFYGESSREAESFLSRGSQTRPDVAVEQTPMVQEEQGFSPEILKILQESEDLLKGRTTESLFTGAEEADAPSAPSAPPIPVTPADPDSFGNRVGRSFNEFQRYAAEGIGVYGRLINSPELEQWAIKDAKKQEEDVKTYGIPTRTSSFTERISEVTEDYETEGIGAALESGGLLLKDMLGDAIGSLGPSIGAGLVAIPVAAVGGTAAGAATALILPFMVGGLAGTGQVKEEALNLGADPEIADKAASAGGVVIGVLDKIGASLLLKSFVKEFGKKAVTDELGKKVGKEVAETAVTKGLKFAGNVAKGSLKGGISEGITETAQEATQIAAAGLAADKTAIPYEGAEYFNRLVDAGALGVVGGKAAGAGTSALGGVLQTQSANRAIELEETLDELAKGVRDQETELGGSFGATGTRTFGREKSSKQMTDRPIISTTAYF